MPHISNKKLNEKYFQKIYDQLISLSDTAGNKRKSDILFKEFLTETEKIMFAKRLAVVCMLYEGVSKSYISQILLVSPSTVSRISLLYEIKAYPYITQILHKNSRAIWSVIGDMIEEGISMKVGKKRLSWLDDIERKYNRKIFRV